MAQNELRGVPTAAGHVVYPIEKKFSRAWEEYYYCTSMLGEIATRDTLNPLRECGQEIEWRTPPRATLHTYYINAKLKVDFPEYGKRSCKIGKGKYWNVKLDHVNMQQICDSKELMSLYQQDASRQMKQIMELDIIREMMLGAHPQNQGCCAGIKKPHYDIGECTDCCIINCDNIRKFVRILYSILGQQCVVNKRRGTMQNDTDVPFLLVPPEFGNVYEEAMAKGCCPSSEITPLETGRIPTMIGGFDVYEVPNLPCKEDANGNFVYPILFGRKDATGFVTTIDKIQTIENHPDYFADFMRGLTIWGGCVIKPEALGLAWACFEEEKIK